jgi:hypothetical protein
MARLARKEIKAFRTLEINGAFYVCEVVARDTPADYTDVIFAPVDMISAFNHRQSADFLAAGLSRLPDVRTMRVQVAKLRAFRPW